MQCVLLHKKRYKIFNFFACLKLFGFFRYIRHSWLFSHILFLSSLSLPFFPILFHLISYTSFSSVPLHCHLSLPVPASHSVSSVFPSLFCFLSVYFLPVPSPKYIPLSFYISPDSFRSLPIIYMLLFPIFLFYFVFLSSFLFHSDVPPFLVTLLFSSFLLTLQSPPF